MSLLLDALKQAEKQKNAESTNDEDLPEGKFDEIEFNLDEPVEQEPTSVPVNENELKVSEPKEIPSLVEKKIDVSIETPSNENKKIREDKTDGLPLDSSLNVFAVGNVPSSKGRNKKYTLIGLAVLVIVLLAASIWYLFENESTSDFSEQLIEGDPLINEREALEEVSNMQSTPTPPPLAGVTNKITTPVENIKKSSLALISEDEIAKPSASTGIKIKKRIISVGVFTQIDAAYKAMQLGKLAQAKSIYLKVLKSRPNQVDALLGLANIEVHEGSKQNAITLYEKVLAKEQTNVVAQLGLLRIYSNKTPLAKQQILEELSSKHPKNISVLKALGQSLSAQSKWAKAQEIYFKGYSLQPNSVFFTYNLAVSLDQLGKGSAASSYYEKAINLNKNASDPVDITAIENRLQELRGAK